jgi:hypothetical protein
MLAGDGVTVTIGVVRAVTVMFAAPVAVLYVEELAVSGV